MILLKIRQKREMAEEYLRRKEKSERAAQSALAGCAKNTFCLE